MVLPFLPNEADATYPDQAEPDSVDIEILLLAYAGTGVISGCAVTESGTPAQTVDVASGEVLIDEARVTVSAQAGKAVTAADGTNPRIDVISVNTAGTAVVTAGTPASQPVAPDVPANSAPLAFLYVPANDNTHGDAQINNKRVIVLPRRYIVEDLDGTGAPVATVNIDSAHTGTGGAAFVPVGIQSYMGNTNPTSFNHAIAILGFIETVKAGQHYGVEGRVDAQNATGDTAIGVHGLATLDGASQTSIFAVGVDGLAELGPGGSTPGAASFSIGGRFIGREALYNYNLIIGEGAASGENGLTSFRGYITDGAGQAIVDMAVSDALDRFYIEIVDAKLDGITIKLRDAAGASSFRLVDSADAVAFEVASDGAITNKAIGEESGNFTADRTHRIVNVDTAGGASIVTLPDCNTYSGHGFLFRRDGASSVTINRAGSDTFDDAATSKVLGSDGAAIGFFSIGDTEWKIVDTIGTVT